MTNCLRTFLSAVLCAVAMGCWAQAPQSGTYHIKGSNGKYVEIKGKYYAQPNATTQSDYTKITLGVGYNTGDGYRVYSLQGTNPTDGSTIEVYDYIQKACNIVSQFGQEKMNGKIQSMLKELLKEDDGTVSEDNQEAIDQIVTMMDAMADSVCRIYTDDYAYMTLVPEGHYGDKWVVRAKATVPAIPYTVEALGDKYTKGHVVITGHECTGIWDWVKQHVLKYLQSHSTNYQLKNLVEVYLDQVEPGTTYYLTCEDNETFGYSKDLTDDGLWTLEAVETEADGLTPNVYNIQNQQTQLFVNMKGKYDAAPELTLSDIQGSTANKKSAAFTLDFGRYDRANKNLYRITELANDALAIDACAYITKGMNKAYELVDKKLKDKDYYTKLANKVKQYTDVELTAAQISADIKTAVDLFELHYAYLKLLDNTDGTVSLFVDVPEVPALLDFAAQLYAQMYQKREDYASVTFEMLVKEQLDKYFNDETSHTDNHLRNLWKQNRDKWHFGKRYYLAADEYKTFDYAETQTAAAKWVLTNVQDEESTTNPKTGYFRVKNVGGYQASTDAALQQYVEVKGRASADVATTNDEKFTKAGTVIYLNLDNNATDIMAVGDSTKTVKAYEVLNLRSQGIDVMGGAESTMEELAKMIGEIEIGDDNSIDLTPAYNGYIGFARYMLAFVAKLGEESIAGHATDWWDGNAGGDTPQANANKELCKSVLDDFVENYLPELKMQVYMIPVEGKEDTYYIRSMVPSLAPIANFYKTHKEVMDTLVIPCVDRFLRDGNHYKMLDKVGFKGEYFTYADEGTVRTWNGYTYGLWDYAERDAKGNLKKYSCEEKPIDGTSNTYYSWKEDPSGEYYRVAYSTILNDEWLMFNWMKLQAWHALEKMGYDANSTLGGYLGMIHYGVPYFLIQGDNHDASGNRTYVGNTSLGFANDGAVHGTYNDLANAKEHAYWTLEPVDAENYFAVKPNSNKGKNGKYYSSVYVDFPFTLAGENATAAYALNEKGVQDGTEKQTGEDGTTTEVSYKYVTFDKATDVVPAATPTILEFTQNTIDGNIAIVPVVSSERSEKNELVQGTFFGGYHYVDIKEAEGDGYTALIKNMLNPIVNGSIQAKYGVDTDDSDIYLFGYNKSDSRNPYGFYFYHKHGVAGNRNIIPGNKPFLLYNADESNNTKVYVQFGDEELTGIDSVFSEDATTATAERYNLAGQRVNDSYKGVVIVNGQKYIQK